MKAIGFNQGQYGDLCMNLVACKAFKNIYPDGHLTFGINKKYAEIAPIFFNNYFIDNIHIWDGYDNWPTQEDIKYIEGSNFDKIFHPMASLRPSWQPFRHQTEEICLIHGLNPPVDLKINLNKYFNLKQGYNKYISICWQGSTDSHKKNLPNDFIKNLCKRILSVGYKPLFFKEKFENYDYINFNLFEAIQFMLSTKMLITIDSALCWIASGYDFPTIGLYNQNYYSHYGANTSKNWQPINPNANYLESTNMGNFNIDLIEDMIKSL